MSSANLPTGSANESGAKAELTYKDQLDQVADGVRSRDQGRSNQDGVVDQVVDKVSQYVPAVGKVLGKEQDDSTATAPGTGTETKAPGLPERPDHDTQIEEFVRDQHRSRREDATPADQ